MYKNHNNTFKLTLPTKKMEEEKVKIAVISGASHALSYKRKHPNSSDEEAIRHVSREMEKILTKVDKSI